MYAELIKRDEQGMLKRKISEHGNIRDNLDNLSQSESIAMCAAVPSLFTHCLSVGGLMLLVYESSVYLRSERHSKWMQCMTFDSLILTLSTIGTK